MQLTAVFENTHTYTHVGQLGPKANTNTEVVEVGFSKKQVLKWILEKRKISERFQMIKVNPDSFLFTSEIVASRLVSSFFGKRGIVLQPLQIHFL